MTGKTLDQNLTETVNDEFSAADPDTEPWKREGWIDPEDDRENWPTIRIDMEKEKPNYEILIVGGTKKNGEPFEHQLQVMRGVDVKVPPSIVYSLRNAVETFYEHKRDPVDPMKRQLVGQDRTALPWHLVHPGKYC